MSEKITLSPQEIEELVLGAQQFLAPVPDPEDEERFVDETPQPPIS